MSFSKPVNGFEHIGVHFEITGLDVYRDKLFRILTPDLFSDLPLKDSFTSTGEFLLAVSWTDINHSKLRDFANQYTPTTVVFASSRNGRTPLTPSHGYFSVGFSRSPSSRSRKPGMNVSFVSVYSFTRPVWP